MELTEARRLTHGLLNTLHSGCQGHYTALNVRLRLGGVDATEEEVRATASLLDRIGRWWQALREGQALVAPAGAPPPSEEGETSLELLDRFREIQLTFVPRIEQALEGEGPAPGPDTVHLAAALAWYSYAREHYIRGLVDFGELFGREEIADRWRQHLLPCRHDINLANTFFVKLDKGEPLEQDFFFDLANQCRSLPGIFRSQSLDALAMGAAARGGLTWEAAGFDSPDADRWEGVGMNPQQAGYWVAYGFAPAEVPQWAQKGFPDAAVAGAWSCRGFDCNGAALWRAAGFDATEAARWVSVGIADPDEARRRNEGAAQQGRGGVRPPST